MRGMRITKAMMQTNMSKTILLVDGYKLTRYCLKELIETEEALLVVEAADMPEARRVMAVQAVDLVLIDISDPCKNGLESFCDLKELLPGIPILVVNGEHGDQQVMHYLRLGCKGYLTRHAPPETVLASVRQTLAGEFLAIYEENAPVSILTAGHDVPVYATLSFRELQVFLKLLKGKSTSLIARELRITASSVSIFKSRLLQKLQLHSHADLIAYALRSHLVRLPEGLHADNQSY